MADKTKTSKFIALLLRHKPEAAGLTLDEHGWADTDELIQAVNTRYPLNREALEEIVRTDEKQRYAFNEDHSKIRANQGHSIPVDVEPEKKDPPEFLYHGTADRFEESILREGLKAQSRLYVHLSSDEETALSVGKRHGRPVIFRVRSGDMAKDGHSFWLSANHVWLCESVPPKYLERIR